MLVQPTSVVENRHDRHGNLMQGTYDDRFVCRRAQGHYGIGSACHKAKTPAGLIQRGFHFKSLAVTYSCMAKDHTTIGMSVFTSEFGKGDRVVSARYGRQADTRAALAAATNLNQV